MTKEEFYEKIRIFNINITEEQKEQLEKYAKLLIAENKLYNLTAIVNLEDIYLKHFYDSLTILNSIDLKDVKNLLDIGSGAGFPGLVLKIFFPHLKVFLLDANNKKIKFLSKVINELHLKDVSLIYQRAETFAKNAYQKFDVVTNRAVASFDILLEISLPMVKKNGFYIALKGKNISELNENIEVIKYLGGEIIQKINFTLNDDYGERNIIKIQKIKNTDKKYPRNYEKILKCPLKNIIK